jgi:non-ribosomal peptide synthetase component E (peptide arylation enzyme)
MGRDNRQRNLGYFFDHALKRVPDKIAIIDLFGGAERCSTYRRLNTRMESIARMLVRLGIRPGERVAMLVFRMITGTRMPTPA